MSIDATFNELIESAWVTVLGNSLDLTAIAGVSRWRPFSEIDFTSLGHVFVTCPRIAYRPNTGNTIIADPAYIELMCVTHMTNDANGTAVNTILGAVLDVVAVSTIKTQLNTAADRLNVIQVRMDESEAYADDQTTHRQRNITIACHFTVNPPA